MHALARDGAGVRGRLSHHEPLSAHTSWGVGGPADTFYEPADIDDLSAFLAALPADEPLFWLGLGSNLLVRDGGIVGTVVHIGAGLDRFAPGPEAEVTVGAGTPCPKVARLSARAELAGCEFLAGIPGTMGGALAMNAGAFGGDTWSLVRGVRTVDRRGELHVREPSHYQIGYRSVQGPPGEWFVECELALAVADGGDARGRVRELLARRARTQPLRQRSCGSVFRNPPGAHAAALIESSGLKGRRVGGAVVSPQHANFIVNEGQASAADVEALIALVRDTVLEDHGIVLEPEVRIVGREAVA